MQQTNVQYGPYLQLDAILNAQHPESDKLGLPAHDEMLFIVIHQAYELWFKQLLFEVESVADIMSKPAVNDNSPELQTVVHRLNRSVTILKLLVQQIDIMETMTPMDFLDFRDMLRPASGFQSWQFKTLEARLGLQYENRFGQEYYISQLTPDKIEIIRRAEREPSVLKLLNDWLERMPFFEEPGNWADYQPATNASAAGDSLWFNDYRNIYMAGLADAEQANRAYFDKVFGDGEGAGHLSPRASRAALFIMLYRGYPLLQLPFQLLNALLEIDEQLSTWRYRHMSMVQRVIGTRIGTGGSTGRDYLKGALDKHYIFADIARLTSFLIERRKLPELSPAMGRRLGFR
ncbi:MULTISPECIES: tryptophan 2,3-dioxygenase [Chitinophaga]|uniref:Tryptophan 2,3-dioxygenase n=1 Tax=Chitinophaga caseinilytica TaxID=2267521 RepID=A0ABZ2Z6F4_9BACT|nr:tryptophan 2,3-dioxygenase family protein [Chitinophaga rhizosphaerae]